MKPNFFIRMMALFLVLCLMTDPMSASAVALLPSSPTVGSGGSIKTMFTAQALALKIAAVNPIPALTREAADAGGQNHGKWKAM